jgi:hypothetical protein
LNAISRARAGLKGAKRLTWLSRGLKRRLRRRCGDKKKKEVNKWHSLKIDYLRICLLFSLCMENVQACLHLKVLEVDEGKLKKLLRSDLLITFLLRHAFFRIQHEPKAICMSFERKV